jgi:hypothetical protein
MDTPAGTAPAEHRSAMSFNLLLLAGVIVIAIVFAFS